MKRLSRSLTLFAIAALGLVGCASPVALHPVSNEVPPVKQGVYDVRNVSVPPIATRKGPPHYPEDLRSDGVEGTTVMVFTVKSDGSVEDVIVRSATDVRFGDAAAAAVRSWQYRPAQLNGHPVDCRIEQPVSFSLAYD
jgi:protein TonB